MTPLGLVVAGLGVVVVDLRFDELDLLPDVLGWAAALIGLARLSGRSGAFTAAAIAAGCGVPLGAVLLAVRPGALLSAVEIVVLGVVIVGTLTGIRQLVDDPRSRTTADRLRWIHLAMFAVGLLVVLLGEPTRVTGAAAGLLVLGVVVVFVAFGWFLVLLWTHRHDPALTVSGGPGEAGSLRG